MTIFTPLLIIKKNEIMELTDTTTWRVKSFEFKDYYGDKCVIQDSTITENTCLRFGKYDSRMTLTQEQVKALLPLLEKFAKTGNL